MTHVAIPVAKSWSRETTSLVWLGALGLAALLITGAALRLYGTIDWNLVVVMMLLSGVIAIVATKVAAHAPAGLGLAIVLGVALALRLLALSEDPILSNDMYRYVWDGWVQGAGINPYRYVPADPALAGLRDGVIYPNINRADYATTIYPPVAQFFFFTVTRIGQSITAMRIALIGCEVVTLLALIDILRRFNKPMTLAVAYAWHPLAVWEIANSGHVDALMVTLVMIGVWLMVRHRRIAAGLAIAFAALVKPYAVVALPACWRPWDWRLPLVVVAAVTACYLPYMGAGKGVFGFLLTGYLYEEGLQGGEGFWLVHAARTLVGNLPGLLPLYLALAAGTLGLLALRAAFTTDQSPERMTRDVAALLLAGLFFLSPNYPWYFLVVIPFIPIGGGAPAWALSLGAILLNLLYPDYDARFLLWKGVISGAFLIAVLVTQLRLRRLRTLACVRDPSSIRLPEALRWTR